MIQSFMKWYGEPVDDVKIKVPKTRPPYIEDSDVEKVECQVSKQRYTPADIRSAPSDDKCFSF
jgi:hypothetical protein